MASRISANPQMPTADPANHPPIGQMVSMMGPMLSQVPPVIPPGMQPPQMGGY